MNIEEYKKAFFSDPEPEPRFRFEESVDITLYYEDFDRAVAFYAQVLGPPAYAEGAGTKGWRVGGSWLTLLRGKIGNPKNLEVTLRVETPDEAERLHQAFIHAGGMGPAPSDELMYEPVRYCSVRDPLGTDVLIVSPLRH